MGSSRGDFAGRGAPISSRCKARRWAGLREDGCPSPRVVPTLAASLVGQDSAVVFRYDISICRPNSRSPESSIGHCQDASPSQVSRDDLEAGRLDQVRLIFDGRVMCMSRARHGLGAHRGSDPLAARLRAQSHQTLACTDTNARVELDSSVTETGSHRASATVSPRRGSGQCKARFAFAELLDAE